MKVCFDTFGCRLNRAEALEEEAKYVASGWELTQRHSDADLIVVRGCSVTARAQRDCEKLISHLRRHYPTKRLVIQGCLPKSLKTAPGPKIPGKPPADSADALPARTARAYLKVQDGCNCGCTYCIVPRFRGKSVSFDFENVIDKAKRFVDSGYREIVVTGCNLSLYSSQGRHLPDLVSALSRLSPARIRLGSVEPGAQALETVSAMSENASVCRFLHLSAQSGSESVLAAMKRPYRAKDIDALARKALELMPDIRLGCDIICGFPGELDIDHLATKSMLQRLPFTNAHVFPYSERPGTPAASFRDVVPKPVRHARAHELTDIAMRSQIKYAKKFTGRTVEIIVERNKPAAGWTGEYLWCSATGAIPDAPRKSSVKIQVTSAGHDGTLKGRITDNGG
jgi:threonylcarbamoyladenosine tRNA methylthiotransferase MtaB